MDGTKRHESLKVLIDGLHEPQSENSTLVYALEVAAEELKTAYSLYGLSQKPTDLIWQNSNFHRSPKYTQDEKRIKNMGLLFEEIRKARYLPILYLGSEPVPYYKRMKLPDHIYYVEASLPPNTEWPIADTAGENWQIGYQGDRLPILNIGQAIYHGGKFGLREREEFTEQDSIFIEAGASPGYWVDFISQPS